MAFNYSRVYDREKQCLVHLRELPSTESAQYDAGALDFLGPDMDAKTATLVAEGKVCPITHKPWDDGTDNNNQLHRGYPNQQREQREQHRTNIRQKARPALTDITYKQNRRNPTQQRKQHGDQWRGQRKRQLVMPSTVQLHEDNDEDDDDDDESGSEHWTFRDNSGIENLLKRSTAGVSAGYRDNDGDANSWPCHLCTYENSDDYNQCEICETSRRATKRRRVVQKEEWQQIAVDDKSTALMVDTFHDSVQTKLQTGTSEGPKYIMQIKPWVCSVCCYRNEHKGFVCGKCAA